MAFSHKFRLYLIVTADFRMFFLNELYNLIQTLDMSQIRLVNFAEFFDREDKLIVGGKNGVTILDLVYKSKYSPKQASQID